MRTFLLTLLLVLVGLTAASADIVHMRDGTKREGRIVEETDETIVLEVAVGSTRARVTVRRADVDRIEQKLTEQEKLEAEFAKRLKALDKTSADAVIDLGKWCISKKFYADAEKLYKDLATQGDAHFARAHLALADMEYDRARLALAKSYLQALLDKNPNDLDAKLLFDRIADEEKAAAARLLTDAIDLYDKGKFDAALDKLESFHDRVPEEHQKSALAKAAFPDGMKLEDFVAQTRLSVPCPACRAGAKTCPACKGKPDEDAGVCRTCGGAGTVICDKCGGTGAKSGNVPEWEMPGIVRAMEKYAAAEAAEFRTLADKLTAGVPREQLAATAWKAGLSAWRAVAWLSALEDVARQAKNVTTRDASGEREAIAGRWRGLCVALGDAFDKAGRDAWTQIEATETGPLAQDRAVRAVRDDLVRAMVFYGKTRARDKDPYAQEVQRKVDNLGPLVAQIDQTLDRNAKILRAFDIAMKNIFAKRAKPALDILVEIVKVSSKTDLTYLSQLTAQKTNATLPEAMAALRFEAGKDKGEFGDTTEYERAAFMKRLLGEADGMAGQAQNGYDNMKAYSAIGKRNSCPPSLVHKTREQAQDARRWYKAALAVPYPLSSDRRKAISDLIGDMASIIDRCARWYTTPGGPTGGTSIGIGM